MYISYLNCRFNYFSPFLFLRLCWNHSITLNIFLNDLIYCWSCNAYSLGNIGDWHSNRFQVPIFPESQFNDPNFHGKLHLWSLLQEFVQVSDWQVNYFGILFFQNDVWWILFHLLMELFSFLMNRLDHLYLARYGPQVPCWNYELRKIHFS